MKNIYTNVFTLGLMLLLCGCPSADSKTGGSDETGTSQVDLPEGCILPTTETILSGEYKPLARPLFVYVNKKSLERPNVRTFVEFYMNDGQALVSDVGYVQLPEADLKASREVLKAALESVKANDGADESVVMIDGSSTVFPISQRMAEEMKEKKNIVTEVGRSGTGGGFDKFARGELDLSDASRTIKDSEAEKMKEGGVEYRRHLCCRQQRERLV